MKTFDSANAFARIAVRGAKHSEFCVTLIHFSDYDLWTVDVTYKKF